MDKPLAPFTCSFTPVVPELLWKLNISLAISTYQAGKVVFISAKNAEQLVQLPRTFQKPMGLALKDKHLAIATQQEVLVLANADRAAPNYPSQPNTYDALFMPRATYYTGVLDLHDIDWGKEGLWAVNTQFSCLALIGASHSFNPVWKPPFISSIKPGDCCHLNGMAMLQGRPRYVTALGTSDQPEGWRAHKAQGGVLIDVSNNEIILENLAMPHSPRIVKNQLYILFSATGELARVAPAQKQYEVVQKFPGFARGLAAYGDYLFVGLSQLRTSSKAFQDLPIAKQSVFAGIVILHQPTHRIVGHIKYESSVEEIYDVQVMPGLKRPGVLNTERQEFRSLVTSPQQDFWAVEDGEQKNPQY